MEATDGARLALLILGFVVAEYALWRWKPGAGGPDGRPGPAPASRYLAHGAIVAAAHLAAYAPFLTPWAALVLAGLAAAHVLVERVAQARPGLASFALEQAAHAAALAAAWLLLAPGARAALDAWLTPERLETMAVLTAAYAFVVWGGNLIVVRVLARFDLLHRGVDEGHAESAPMGRAVGVLERVLALTLVLVNQWAALGLFFAAKHLVRGEPIKKDARFGEYYLIGTFTSLLIAVGAGLAARALLP